MNHLDRCRSAVEASQRQLLRIRGLLYTGCVDIVSTRRAIEDSHQLLRRHAARGPTEATRRATCTPG